MCVCMHVHGCICVSACVWVNACMCVHGCMGECVCVGVCVCMCVQPWWNKAIDHVADTVRGGVPLCPTLRSGVPPLQDFRAPT